MWRKSRDDSVIFVAIAMELPRGTPTQGRCPKHEWLFSGWCQADEFIMLLSVVTVRAIASLVG